MREVLDASITVENRFPNDFLIYIAISLLLPLNENVPNFLNFIYSLVYSLVFLYHDEKEKRLSRKFSVLNSIKFAISLILI